MAYLLDANVFIEAQKNYYSFATCPAFWDWLIRENGTGKVISHKSVLEELIDYGDELSTWAKHRGRAFFILMDAQTSQHMATVADWVQNADYKQAVKNLFLSGADPILIPCALAHSHTVVSHEVHIEGLKRKVKIPTVCRALGVRCITTFQMLAAENARFQL